jgi:glycopeptide antibiotics resistance protein
MFRVDIVLVAVVTSVALVGISRSRGASWATALARAALLACLVVIAMYTLVPPSGALLHDVRFDGFPTFVPFRTIRSYLAHGVEPSESRQLGGNVALFVPLGFAMPLAIPRFRTFSRTLLAGIAISTFVELGQMVVPAHGPDIDDIILNTLGVAIGSLLWFGAVRLASLARRSSPAFRTP